MPCHLAVRGNKASKGDPKVAQVPDSRSDPFERAGHDPEQRTRHEQPPYAIQGAADLQIRDRLYDGVDFAGQLLIHGIDLVVEPSNVDFDVGNIRSHVFDIRLESCNTLFQLLRRNWRRVAHQRRTCI
jgi:hypothetical protein